MHRIVFALTTMADVNNEFPTLKSSGSEKEKLLTEKFATLKLLNERVKKNIVDKKGLFVQDAIIKVNSNKLRVDCFSIDVCIRQIETLEFDLNSELKERLNYTEDILFNPIAVNIVEYAELKRSPYVLLFLSVLLSLASSVAVVVIGILILKFSNDR